MPSAEDTRESCQAGSLAMRGWWEVDAFMSMQVATRRDVTSKTAVVAVPSEA